MSVTFPWVAIPALGSIRISTVLAAVILFAVVAWRRGNPFTGLLVAMAWASSFEIVYNALGVLTHHWSLGIWVWQTAALAGWVTLAHLYGVRPDRRLGAAFVALMASWLVSGYRANLPGAELNWTAEVFNEAAKTTLAAAYLVGALGLPRMSRTSLKHHVKKLQQSHRLPVVRRAL